MMTKLIKFDPRSGLVPVITQDYQSNKVLMFAYANEEAVRLTVQSGKATYYSRSREKLWCKGEESGNYQEIIDILIDCDNDCLIYKVAQHGLKAACHEGYESCFFRHFHEGEWVLNGEKRVFEPSEVYKKPHDNK